MYTGEDKILEFEIEDPVTGELQDIDDMVDLVVYLMSRGSSVPLVKYKKTIEEGETGFETLDRQSATTYLALVGRAITSLFPVDELYLEVATYVEDARFEDGVRVTKGEGTVDDVEESNIP